MLDTNVVSALMRKPSAALVARADALAGKLAISAIVAAELRFGSAKRGDPPVLFGQVTQAIQKFQIFDWTAQCVEQYALLRTQLELLGKPIGALDTLIAAHALTLNAILVTHNTREFTRIPELRVENWLDPKIGSL
jgi:tRNA(fMet)-specific endonuclease VapC